MHFIIIIIINYFFSKNSQRYFEKKLTNLFVTIKNLICKNKIISFSVRPIVKQQGESLAYAIIKSVTVQIGSIGPLFACGRIL